MFLRQFFTRKSEVKKPKVEPSEYQSLRHAQPAHEDYVVINWCLGNTCNYACSYCPDGLHNASSPWPDLQTVKDFCARAIEHYKGKKLYFEFTGGEVTLWRDLPALATFLKERGCKVGIISNASRSEEFWTKLIPFLDHVCLSFHPQSAKADHFLSIVKMCADQIRTHVNFMMHPDHFVDLLDLAYKVKDIPNISIAIQPLVKDFGEEVYPYTPTQKKIIDTQNAFLAKQIKYDKSYEYYRGAMDMVYPDGRRATMSPQRFISSGKNSWKGWSCYAGLEQIVVNIDGDIFRGWCTVGGALGNVKNAFTQFPTKPILCTKSFCHCNLDIMTTKVREH